MTDRELLTAMLDRAGVVWEEEAPSEVTIVAKAGPNNEGYMDFIARFHFAPDGSLTRVGIWE